MAKCKLCTNTNAKYLLENARHLTSEKVCLDCYQTFNEDTNQTHLFQEDTNTPMSYDQFLEIYPKLGYEKIADFSQEIGISANTPSTTWKKKGEVPYLVKYFLESKLNKVESKVEIENNIDKNDYYELCSKYRELKHKYDLYILKNSNDPTEKAHAAYLGDPFKDLVDANKRNKELKKEIGTLKMDENELIQTVYAIKKGIFYMYHQKKFNSAKNRSIESIAFSRDRIRTMVKYLKRLFKFYDINNRPELELIHSTFIKIKDYKRFEGYYTNISYMPGQIKKLDTRYEDLEKHASRMWYANFNFGNSITSVGWNDLIRYATKR